MDWGRFLAIRSFEVFDARPGQMGAREKAAGVNPAARFFSGMHPATSGRGFMDYMS
jgi:hypothetical protein